MRPLPEVILAAAVVVALIRIGLRRRRRRESSPTVARGRRGGLRLFGDTGLVAGREIRERTPRGEPIAGDSFLLLLNAGTEPVAFTLPARRLGPYWELLWPAAAAFSLVEVMSPRPQLFSFLLFAFALFAGADGGNTMATFGTGRYP